MKQTIIISIFIAICSLLCATDYVAITEIMYDTPLEEDPNEDCHNEGEFIELYNAHEDEADISGWSIETINPQQHFRIPDGTRIAPQSTLVLGYYDSDYTWGFEGLNEQEAFKEYFCSLYNIDYSDKFAFIYQDSVALPNDTTILVLKDNTGLTRDSAVFGIQFEESPQYAPNDDLDDDDIRNLENVFSIQRTRINFNANGTTLYSDVHWVGKNVAVHTQDIIPNNSVGSVEKGIFACNIIPSETENSLQKCNFILEITPRVTLSNIDTALLNPDTATIKRTYYDPMYRPTISILYGNSPTLQNIATLKEYDEYARPTIEWLPIALEMNYLTNSTFKNISAQFYTDTRPFVENTYSADTWENGTIKNELSGTQKAGIDMGTHKMAFSSRGNRQDEVKLFYVDLDGELNSNGYYSEGVLSVMVSADEDNKTKIVYTNLQNQVVMETIDNAPTYYVYNDLNQLCYVLPPLAANQITDGTYSDTTDVLKKYAYVYKYDERGNQIYKRLPGCEPTFMVYDITNTLVMSQTGTQRQRGTYWTVYKCDALRRIVYTSEVNIGHADYDYLWNTWDKLYVKESFSLTPQANMMTNTGYTRSFYHIHPTTLLTVNYYDTYEFLDLMADSVRNHMTFAAFDDNATCANAKGLLTGTRTYYMDGSGDYSETVYYYDYRGREIQRRSTNHLGGYDVLSTKYDFVSNITDTWSNQSTNNGLTTTEHYQYTYDHANRPLTTTYTFNNESSIVLQTFHYDELGRVRSRHLHGGIDSVTFAYNIRDQITQIKSSGYEQKYYYNQVCPIGSEYIQTAYNGNISATTWTYGNKINGYMYYYDNANRLQSTYSIFNENFDEIYFTENFAYDAHGNIAQLIRYDNGHLIDNISLMYNGNQLTKVNDSYDSYSYTAKQYHDNNTSGNDFAYDANGNMLYDKDRDIAAIRYNLLNLPDTIQFANGNQIVHRYDAVGNRLTTNYYTRKVTTAVPLGNTLTGTNNTTNYNITRDAFHNNIVYTANNNDAYGIEFVHNSEGFIRYYGPSEHYHFYHIKDLLGNIRETYIHPEAGYKECMERTQYYPSGLPWVERLTDSFTAHPWKYNGKEFVEMHGLDEYDSKARWYYPAICRTTTIDPLAEKYYSTSPYAWCGNNPVRFVDPDGKVITFASGTTNEQKDQFWQVVRYLDKHNCAGRYGQLKNSSQAYIINMNVEKSQFDGSNRETPTINWNPNKGIETDNGIIMSPTTVLNHEMTHATHFDNAKKLLDKGNIDAWNAYVETTKKGTSEAYSSKEEELVITGNEQRTARLLGEIKSDEVTRTNHKGKYVSVESPISNKKVEESQMK